MNPHQIPTSTSAAAPESESPAHVSQAKQIANKANAQLSSGPKTPEGKAKSSLNAVKTGLTGRTVLLHADDAAVYQQHVRDYEKELRPGGQRECDLAQSIADSAWRLSRIPALEMAIYAQGRTQFADPLRSRGRLRPPRSHRAPNLPRLRKAAPQSAHPGSASPPPSRKGYRRVPSAPIRAQKPRHRHARSRLPSQHASKTRQQILRSRRAWVRIFNFRISRITAPATAPSWKLAMQPSSEPQTPGPRCKLLPDSTVALDRRTTSKSFVRAAYGSKEPSFRLS